MATLGTLINLFNLNQLTDPKGGIIGMIYSMAELMDILQDIPFIPSNERMSHKFVRSTKLADGTWVKLNNGISASKGSMKTFNRPVGMLESRMTIDNRFMDIESDFAAFVERMAYPHYEGLAQDIADAFTNGTISGGNQFSSIEAHITDASQTDEFGQSMFHDYAGTGSDLSSILAVDWGQDKVYAIYPNGHKFAGVEREEHPNELISGVNSSSLFAYVADFKWYTSLVVADDRCIRRAGNIDSAGTSTNLLDSTYETDILVDMLASMYNLGRNADLYMNRTIWAQFWKVTKDKTNVQYNPGNPWKQPEYRFGNNRIRFSDSLLNTETAVT